jgi:hypothetical protein
MPRKYSQIVVAIETLPTSSSSPSRTLKAVQDREEGLHTEPSAGGGKLLYMVEQWRAFEKKKKKDEGSGSSGSSKERRRRLRGGMEKGSQV